MFCKRCDVMLHCHCVQPPLKVRQGGEERWQDGGEMTSPLGRCTGTPQRALPLPRPHSVPELPQSGAGQWDILQVTQTAESGSRRWRIESFRPYIEGRVFSSLYRGSRWFLAYSLCDACGRLFVKHKFCPVCLKVYRDTEPSPMVCCDSCQKWVHIACDDISEDMYEKFQSEHSMGYTCAACRGTVYKVSPDPEP